MTLGVPYRDALDMPIDMAIALLSPDERPKNTRPVSPIPIPVSAASILPTTTGKRFIASRRKHKSSP